jgi:hypothetical protein
VGVLVEDDEVRGPRSADVLGRGQRLDLGAEPGNRIERALTIATRLPGGQSLVDEGDLLEQLLGVVLALRDEEDGLPGPADRDQSA